MMKPHPEGANAIAIRPDGREAVVALENRLLVYDVATGKLARELPAASNVIRDVAWSPDGKSLLVTVFYDANARLLRPENGIEWGRLPVEREASVAAFSPDGRIAAVGGETGALVLFTLSGGQPRTLGEGRRAVAALAFDGDRLVAGHDGGIVQIWSVAGGTLEREMETGSASARIAARGGRVAMTGRGGAWLLAPGRGEDSGNCQWHRQDVGALAWSGGTLITADASGRVGLWNR
jgi:WD40 repeat protein